MEILEKLVKQHAPALVDKLTSQAGLGADQAPSFLDAAIKRVGQAFAGGGLDFNDLLAGDIGGLIGRIDIAGLASESGVDTGQATTGLMTILPQVLELLQGDSSTLKKLIASLGTGGQDSLLGAAGKLAGKWLN